MRILFLTSRLPFPPVGGDRLRAYHLLEHLTHEHSVTLISFVESSDELRTATDHLPRLKRLVQIPLSRAVSYRNCIRGLFSRDPLQIHYYRSRRMREAVYDELRSGYDVIVCHLIRMAQYLPSGPGIRKIVDLTDAISLNYERARRYRRGPFRLINRIEAGRVRQYEIDTIRRADSTLLISEVDAAHLSTDGNLEGIRIVRNGVALENFPFAEGRHDPDQICFVGNLRYFPNVDAALYLAHEVFPRIRALRPSARLVVVGANPPKSVQQLADGNSIRVTGFVETVVPYVHGSSILLAPMRVGAGVQNKILESLALGTPVVTTPLGAEGLDPRYLSVGEGTHALADRALQIIEDGELRSSRARAGRSYIERDFRWENVLSTLDDCVAGR